MLIGYNYLQRDRCMESLSARSTAIVNPSWQREGGHVEKKKQLYTITEDRKFVGKVVYSKHY